MKMRKWGREIVVTEGEESVEWKLLERDEGCVRDFGFHRRMFTQVNRWDGWSEFCVR